MGFRGWGMHPHAWRVAHPNSTGTEAPGSGPFQTSPFVPLNLAVHLYLYNILCHKLVSVSKYFRVLSANYF